MIFCGIDACFHFIHYTLGRSVVPGGAGGAMTPPDFGRLVNPISTRGTDYAHPSTTSSPGFSDLATRVIKKCLNATLIVNSHCQKPSESFWCFFSLNNICFWCCNFWMVQFLNHFAFKNDAFNVSFESQ